MMPRSSSVESGSFNYGRPSSDPSISMMETIHGGNRDELTLRLDLIAFFMPLLLYCPAFLDISDPIFWSSYS